MDERLKWLGTRISSSLRPKNEDMKNLFENDENRLVFYEFVNNEDVKRLFVYFKQPKQLIASLQPPQNLNSKSIFFLKCNPGTKITRENIGQEVFYMDCTDVPLEHLELIVREVYLPLLCTNQVTLASSGVNSDRIMDILHRLMSLVEITQGHVKGQIVLSLPSIEVLAEAAASPNRRASVLHVLETTVISWIKQIKNVLRHDPISDLYAQFGPEPGPLDEIQMWEKQLSRLRSINEQLDSPVAIDILQNLDQAQSQYSQSFRHVRKDINKAVIDTKKILTFLGTLKQWLDRLHNAIEPQEMLDSFQPLMTALYLVWCHSTYYHQMDKFHNMLRLLSNEVVHRAIEMVGEDILREPLESYTNLKEALKVCAAFRGTYLDYKDKADDQNARNIADNAERLASRPQGRIFMTKMYGPHAYTPRYGLNQNDSVGSTDSMEEEELWQDSPWPARNAPCFDLLNSFMERCNDVLELVETTRHFRLLAGAAEVGGAGSMSLDALVKEIHQKYTYAMNEFFSVVENVLNIDGTQSFERAFFKFRTVVKSLERRLAEIFRIAFNQCPTVEAQLRLLEVFEGVSGRELVQAHLKDKDRQLVESLTHELIQVREMLKQYQFNPPDHHNMPPVVSKLMWFHGLRERVTRPMEKMKQVSPHSLEGDSGWHAREIYMDILQDLDRYESELTEDWQRKITAELTSKLKHPLLIAEEYDEDVDTRPQVVHVNLDPQLPLLLREIHYLSKEPFNIKLPGAAKELLRNTNSFELRVTATRIETIVSKYNSVMRTITEFEKPLFERKLDKIDQLFEQGLQNYTWKMKESVDFIETANSVVCMDVHQNLDIVQTNCHDIADITISWSKGTLDVFQARDPDQSYSMDSLLELQRKLTEDQENLVVPSGYKIHNLVQSSFEAVQISQASPAWQNYVDYIDAIVLDGLKQSTLTSLRSMLNTLLKSNMSTEDIVIPILTIRLELIENRVSFRPPLDQTTSVISVQELVQQWLDGFLARGKLVKMLGPKGTYQDYIGADEEVKQLLEDINRLVEENGEECKKLLEIFHDYAFLWMQDVNETFQDFLHGNFSPNPLRTTSRSNQGKPLSEKTNSTSRATSGLNSSVSPRHIGSAERTFLTPKNMKEGEENNIPSLDEFDAEIEIYRNARDEIYALEEHHDVGWLRVDLKPIQQVLSTYASKWMWTFTKYLSDQVSNMLEKLDEFLKRIEPEIESITGEERDTASFMKMMRLFNEVSAQHSEMDGKFAAMHKTVLLLKKYGQRLPEKTQFLFNAAPGRWNSLKTKVSLAKQRLGPRIQEESVRITRDLEAFGDRVNTLSRELEDSEVYNRDCSISDAWVIIDGFSKRLTLLENEAQDLIELQDLLETSVVNFAVLPQCRHELNNLKQVWETVRVIDEQQEEWKRHRWQKMNTKFLRDETNKQMEIVKALPEDIFIWDVYMGLHESITSIQTCLPLIDDLSNPAMRTRHWKQLVRVTGGAFTIDNDTLKRMTLGELLGLGLQQHVEDVRAIVQRAVKDLSIEQSLKTYEEVWLSKIFELRPHVRVKLDSQAGETTQDNQSEASQSEAGTTSNLVVSSTVPSRSQARTTSRISNQSSHSRNKRNSISSLPASLLNIGEDCGALTLLTKTEAIFDELEMHQVSLQAMQSSSAAGSFLDEVVKWQKRLQTIEAVLTTWLEVQEKWIELEEIFSGADVKTSLSHDASRFSMINRDFRLLMKATEKNPNVLQCCSRKSILGILEHMNRNLENCRRSLLNHLERRRQIFPRFYFLSMEDVLHIVCNGYDLNQVNLYISKLFENVGSLIFEEVEENDKIHFVITGVQSIMGERLNFLQSITCEGQIETWLTSFIQGMRTALQFQLATALGVEKPLQKVKRIQSAGARKIEIPARSSSSSSKNAKAERSSSRQSRQSKGSQERSKSPSLNEEPVNDIELQDSKSWTLDHPTEIVYLATQVQMTDQISKALDKFNDGNKEAIQEALDKVDSSITATARLLKGLEGDKEEQERKEKEESEARSTRNGSKDGDTASETASVAAGRRSYTGSKIGSELNMDGLDSARTPLEDEGSVKGQDSQSLVEPQTQEPVDTMNLAVLDIPQPEVEATAEDEALPEDNADVRLMLFPSQIQKLSALLSLLSHLRDLLYRLISKAADEDPKKSFVWRSQLHYSFVRENKSVPIKCLDAEFEYGFEYLGSGTREVITPLTEKTFVSFTQAIKSNMGSLCVGPMESAKFELVHELSRCFGQPLYLFNCTHSMDYCQLQDIFRGLATTGCWTCFNNINFLQPSVLSVFAQLMGTVMDALKAGKASVHLQSDDVQLNSQATCFALLDSAIPVSSANPDKLLLYTSAPARLPDNILGQFRTISVVNPDFKLAVEVLLFSQGFENGRILAHKTLTLYNLCRKVLGTNMPIMENVYMGCDMTAGFHGWSVQTLKGVVSEAGNNLEKALTKEVEGGDDDQHNAFEREKHEDEQQEKYLQKGTAENQLYLEEEALVTSLRDTFLPRMQSREASLFATLLSDLFPRVKLPMTFSGEDDSQLHTHRTDPVLNLGSKMSSRIKTARSQDSFKSIKDSLNLNTPVIPLPHTSGRFSAVLDHSQKQNLEDMHDAIAVATGDLGLLPGAAFQARVAQLAELGAAHQTIFVIGPPGCGKSECIKTFAVAERERGKTVTVHSIFNKAVESRELLGYLDHKTKEWKDGLLASLIRKICVQQVNPESEPNVNTAMKIMQLDGQADPAQLELLLSLLTNDGTFVLGNNERMIVPSTLRFIWETDNISKLSPALLANVGVLVMSSNDVGWKLILVQWLERRSEADKDLLTGFSNIYIERVINYLTQCTQPQLFTSSKKASVPQYKRVITHSVENMVLTFCNLMDALVNPYSDLSDLEYERYFNFAAVWAFGGTLAVEHRDSFSNYWREQFDQYIDLPETGTMFDYLVDSEDHDFVCWSDIIPTYSGTPHSGIPSDAFVHTVHNEQLTYLLGLLTDAQRHVLLVGENGCGKTSIVNDRIKTVCSGEVAEVLSLTVNANRFTNAKLMYLRMDERLEWKHGKTYVPKGNKRLLCFVDDFNLAQIDEYGQQTAVELVREHIDDGGYYDPTSHAWRYVKNVTYVSTVNPNIKASVPKINQRLLRHFAIFGCPYPGGEDLQHIFSTLIQTHFIPPETSVGASIAASHLGLHDEKIQNIVKDEEEIMRKLLQTMVKVSVEVQDRLRTMYLPTAQRCHYIFTMKDLGLIFKNICLSLQPGCSKKNLLLLWQHESYWIYGHRMVNDVDQRRFCQAFITGVRKQFTDDEQIHLLNRRHLPLFSNLIEQDSGIVTAGMIDARQTSTVSEEDAKTDLYKPTYKFNDVAALMERGVEEYNKTHPRIQMALYKTVVEEVCRLARTIASPHDGAHCVLVAEGCPGRSNVIAKLASHLCGYVVYQINPSSVGSSADYQMEQFKADLVQGYTRAGVKGEKIMLLLNEEELLQEDFLVYLIDFIVSGSISHLFTYEEQTTIINSIRTEVTQAGLTYTRDVAWNFFLKIVRANFRVCLVTGGGGVKFQKRCRDYPSFTKNVNFIWLPHWSKLQLIDHSMHHLKGVSWMTDIQRENIAHMLASMHLVLRQQDGGEKDAGEYRHVTNTTFEKFVERFITLANTRYSEVNDNQNVVTKALQQIRRENEVAIKLRKQLEHEMVVLEERKAGTVKILSQIGQDTAITEQQIKVVRAQLDKIQKLKKLLPEYQVAHERAVYKAIAIVADSKKVVQNINVEKLSELRGMQKPIIDIEDLMAAIIMILKSPSADLTWQKGAKRQMANLERFIEELLSFDDQQLPEQTLNLVEPYLKKPSFDPETLERKTQNSACGALCKWVRGVVRYHRMMISKVKPLHQKVEETTQAVDDAEHKMMTLENKRKALEVRLADLARAFEEATIDKNEQEEKTIKMKKMLDTAAQLRKILKGERQRCQQIFDSYERRLVSIPGGVAMAAGFASYLGPYHHNFRRMMLTVMWPNCLRERGIPLVIDSIDGIKGRVIDWSIDFLKTAGGASVLYDVDYTEDLLAENAEGDGNEVQDEKADRKTQAGKDSNESKNDKDDVETTENSDSDNKKPEDEDKKTGDDSDDKEVSDTDKEKGDSPKPESPKPEEGDQQGNTLETVHEEPGEDDGLQTGSEITTASAPVLTSAQYNKYLRSLIKLLIGEKTLNSWNMKDFGPRQIENASILATSWQRPPILFDPNEESHLWIQRLSKYMNNKKIIQLDMETRSDPHVLLTLEKAIMRGKSVLLYNSKEHIDNVITPLIHHCGTANRNQQEEEPRMISFCGRRTLCHPNFKLFISTPLAKPKFNPEIASTTSMINLGVSHDTLIEDLLTRAFARVRPQLYQERTTALKNFQLEKDTLLKLSDLLKDKVLTPGSQEAMISNPKTLQFIKDITSTKLEIAQRLQDTTDLLNELEMLKDELFPLARRAAMLFAIIRCLSCIHSEYQFSLQYFLDLFDEAVGGEFPPDYGKDLDADEDYDHEDDTSSDADKRQRVGSTPSVAGPTESQNAASTENKEGTEKYEDDFEKEDKQSDEPSQAQPDGTEGDSASTGAAQRLVAGTEVDDWPSIDLPETVPLPTDGVDYDNFSFTEVKQLMDNITAHVFRRIKQSLYEEDCLLFSALLCLNIQSEGQENFSDEELALLLQGNPGIGMQLSLSDFDCEEESPSWLPQEKWEDILALSVLPGPLDSVCVHFAQNSELWMEWYKSDHPEKQPLPFTASESESTEDDKDKDEKQPSPRSPDLGPLNDFHQLLLLRMLRPDRLPDALLRYVRKHLAMNLPPEDAFDLSEIWVDAKRHLGVLLLLPPNLSDSKTSPVSRLKLTMPPVEALLKLAKANETSVEQVKVSEGCEIAVQDAIDTAEKKDGWVIVEDLHLANQAFYNQLQGHLIRLAKSRGSDTDSEKQSSNFCVWITSEPCSSIPDFLVQHLHKVSWSYLSSGIHGQIKEGKPTVIYYPTPQTYFHSAVITTLQQIPAALKETLSQETQMTKSIVYCAVIVQAMLVARQLLGTNGLCQWYTFNSVQLKQVIGTVTSKLLKTSEDGEIPLNDLILVIAKFILCEVSVNDWDRRYIEAAVKEVLQCVYEYRASDLIVGDTAIPLPPTDLDPSEYADWYDKTVADDITLEVLQLHPSTEKESNTASATSFTRNLDRMYQTQNMESGDLAGGDIQSVNISKLRSALDICTEELPCLLDLGQVPLTATEEYDFPYHCPSVISMTTASSTMMPETIGYVLLQECLWLNSILCHIRQQISDLQQNIVGGPEALPSDLLSTVLSLQEEHVPVSWIHPNCQPCTHSLLSWLEDMKKRYNQLYGWVRCGMVPTFKDGVITENPSIARGQLRVLWLGGLVNPQALLTSLRQEKCMVSKSDIEEVVYECVLLETLDTEEYDVDEGGLFLTDMYLQGAGYNYENDCLIESESGLNQLPCVYVRPVLKSEIQEPEDEKDDQDRKITVYDCPVFMNRSQEVEVLSLQLNCPAPADRWTLSRTSLILDPGLSPDGRKKSRSYLMLQRLPVAEEQSEEGSVLGDLDEDSKDSDDKFRSQLRPESNASYSEQSQLSYREMSPKAAPLPPGLGLSRESAMVKGEKAEKKESTSSQGSLNTGKRADSKSSLKSVHKDKEEKSASRASRSPSPGAKRGDSRGSRVSGRKSKSPPGRKSKSPPGRKSRSPPGSSGRKSKSPVGSPGRKSKSPSSSSGSHKSSHGRPDSSKSKDKKAKNAEGSKQGSRESLQKEKSKSKEEKNIDEDKDIDTKDTDVKESTARDNEQTETARSDSDSVKRGDDGPPSRGNSGRKDKSLESVRSKESPSNEKDKASNKGSGSAANLKKDSTPKKSLPWESLSNTRRASDVSKHSADKKTHQTDDRRGSTGSKRSDGNIASNRRETDRKPSISSQRGS